jgi:hypothetical protein
MRLRRWFPPESFFEPLRGTDFQFWGDSKTAPSIREKADRKREKLKARIRELNGVEALNGSTFYEHSQ